MHPVPPLPWRRPVARLLVCSLLAAVAGSAGGCTGLTVATVGAVAGAVGSAFDTGSDIYHLGKIDTAEMARYEAAMAATRAAAKDLRLASRLDRQNPDGTADFSFEDDKGAAVGVHIERRSEGLVHILVDVGFFGSEPTARLFLARLRANLPRPPGTTRPATTGEAKGAVDATPLDAEKG